ncbi:hypothetical protein [Nonomuraea sp. NPDC049624]|uniref:hypothetical protein n=1 Tax=Nonomuraea sp. NPDC049624 TaxID=3154354 RepID=UPI0034266413
MSDSSQPNEHLGSTVGRLLQEIETSCGDCGGSGRREPMAWIRWKQTWQILVARAREEREKAGLPLRQWVTGLENVVGIHGAGPTPPPEQVPAEVAAAEQALADHDAQRPREHYESATCPTCAGVGFCLTEDGKALVRVLERHGFLRMSKPRPTPPPPEPPSRPPNEAYGQQGVSTGTAG